MNTQNNEPREKPILFSAPMVLAILEGRKKVTRRVLIDGERLESIFPSDYSESEAMVELNNLKLGLSWWARCPYGKPGDRLWVREAHFLNGRDPGCEVIYRADPLPCWEGEEQEIRWRPSIHMHRWASRILLEVTEVRVERLQDISEDQAQAEGAYTDPACPAYDAFAQLWQSINGAGSWESNPWVWVVDFKRIQP
ncbi:MAG: hypothetical protein ACRBBM_12665 [Pseudomonadaceae bacterium]